MLNRDDSPDSHLTASATASWTATVSSLLYDALLRVVRKVAEVAATAASVHGDFGDDSATAPTLARAAAWRRENPELAEKQAPSSSTASGNRDNPGGAVKETLLALELSPGRLA